MIKIHTNQDILSLELVTKHDILNLNLVIKKVFGSKNKCHFLVLNFFVLMTTLNYGDVEGPDKKKSNFFGRILVIFSEEL